jgi:hypothetical protein
MMDLRQGDGSADLPVGRRQSGTAELTKPGLIEGTKKHCGRINRCRHYSFLIADSGCVCGSSLPDIGRATATVRLGIADAAPATATHEIARRYSGRRQRGCNSSRHRLRERRFGLKGPGGLAIRPSEGRESHDQYQEAAHCSSRTKSSRLTHGIAIGNEPVQFRSDEWPPQGGAAQARTRKPELWVMAAFQTRPGTSATRRKHLENIGSEQAREN